MNFITKNLGWILLLCFFVFMLFIISSNNGDKNFVDRNSHTGTDISQSATGDNLEELINMLDSEENNISDEDKVEISGDITKEKRGILSFFKRGDKKSELEVDIKSGINADIKDDINAGATEQVSNANDAVQIDDIRDEGKEEENTNSEGLFSRLFGSEESGEILLEDNTDSEESFIVSSDSDKIENRQTENLIKDSENKEITKVDYTYSPEVKNIFEKKLPGHKLETAVGNKYALGVQSLKLNNKYFNETLGYLSKGDIVTQKSPENSYGCFEVTVEKNNTTGYVCKKWFIQTDDTVLISKKIPENTQEDARKEVQVENPTYIGDQITISDAFVVIDDIPLERGDIVDQITDTNVYGCFTALVRQSYIIPAQGQIIELCHTDLK